MTIREDLIAWGQALVAQRDDGFQDPDDDWDDEDEEDWEDRQRDEGLDEADLI